MGQIRKVSLKPGFLDCCWRAFEYCSGKWVPDDRSWVTETTYGEVSFGWGWHSREVSDDRKFCTQLLLYFSEIFNDTKQRIISLWEQSIVYAKIRTANIIYNITLENRLTAHLEVHESHQLLNLRTQHFNCFLIYFHSIWLLVRFYLHTHTATTTIE